MPAIEADRTLAVREALRYATPWLSISSSAKSSKIGPNAILRMRSI
jgi:hypothetical protein